MPKATNVPPLTLSNPRSATNSPTVGTLPTQFPDSPASPKSAPQSPIATRERSASDMQIRIDSGATSPRFSTIPDPPLSPGQTSPKQHSRDPSKSFFSNLMASKSSHKLQPQSQTPELGIVDAEKRNGRSRGSSKDRSQSSLRKQTSTPDLPRIMTANGRADEVNEQPLLMSADGSASKQQKSKSKFGGILGRNKPGRLEDDKKQNKRAPTPLNIDIHPPPDPQSDPYAAPLKTAPIKNSFREQIQAAEGAAIRNRSADRTGHEDSRPNGHFGAGPPAPLPMHRDGNSLFASFHQTGRGVGDRLGKAGRGLLSKMTRSGSSNERELIPDEHYVCTTINLPLIKQTRKTRIAKKLENSNDKTEYWMPALPWRCIDYLNMQCEQEGLYRVPGSGRDVKFWQRRFDTEYDINLFEEPELYDVNTIASMFKAWLRDLPDELFPKATQLKIAKECHGAQQTPQMLKDELSKLPPFNYYLLFAITCHLSLLHSYADQNKMDYRNLCICFQPCLKIDAFCFGFLVIDWKECWQQGCWTEKEHLQEELRYEKEGSIHKDQTPANNIVEERAVSSSNSSANQLRDTPGKNIDGANGYGRGTPAPQSQPQLQPQSQPQSPQPQSQPQPQPPPQPQSPPPPQPHEQQQAQQNQQSQQQPQQAQSVPLRPKQRSLSSSGRERTRTPSHGHAQTAPAVPRLVTKTPEQEAQQLPELGNMSPIRM